MKRFRFRLQPPLKVAKNRERNAQHEFLRAEGEENQIRLQLDAIRKNWRAWQIRLRRVQRGEIDLRKLKEHMEIVRMLQRRIGAYEDMLRAAEQTAAAKREQLTEVAKERRALERLREKMHAEYAAECAAQAVKTTDDMVAVRVAIARGNGGHDAPISGASS